MQNRVDLKEELVGKYILCICEGKAEKAIIDMLVDGHLLIFEREDMIGKECTLVRSARNVEKEFLNKEYGREVVILRVLDRERKNENFHLSKLYADRYPVYDIVTKPEIEVLHIIHAGKWKEFKKEASKHNIRPSEFFRQINKGGSVKSEGFIQEYYDSADELVKAIREYQRVTAHKELLNLGDLLKT